MVTQNGWTLPPKPDDEFVKIKQRYDLQPVIDCHLLSIFGDRDSDIL